MERFNEYMSTNTNGSTFKWVLLYLAIFVFFVLVIFLLSNKRIQQLPLIRPLVERRDVNRRAKVFWTNTLVDPVLKVESSELADFKSDSYSMLLDVVWFNSRAQGNTNNVSRHIVHRGSSDLQLHVASGSTQMCPTVSGGGMTSSGLPERMNPGVFADPYLNDLLVFIDTEHENKYLRESVRIPDIPMDTPFRLGIVVQKRLLEVYINCQLEVTKVLDGTPVPVENVWYGRAGNLPFVGQIQTLKLWPFPLSATQIRPQCPMPIEFKNLESPCNTIIVSEPTVPSGTPAPVNPLLTYGNSLSVCKSTGP
jgi:hypothetical protein